MFRSEASPREVCHMFDSLDEQMKHDRERESSKKERMMMWAVIAVVSVALFAGLLLGVTKLA